MPAGLSCSGSSPDSAVVTLSFVLPLVLVASYAGQCATRAEEVRFVVSVVFAI